MKNEDKLIVCLKQFTGGKLHWEVCGSQDVVTEILDAEYEIVKQASSKRQREFLLGRNLLRKAARQFDICLDAIGRDEHRAPNLPKPIVTSLSHNDNYVLVAMCVDDYQSIGIDIESSAALMPRLQHSLFTLTEKHLKKSISEKIDYFKLLFSAKESLFKCYYNAFKFRLAFKDVSITLLANDRMQVKSENVNIPQKFLDRIEGYFWCDNFTVVTLFCCRSLRGN